MSRAIDQRIITEVMGWSAECPGEDSPRTGEYFDYVSCRVCRSTVLFDNVHEPHERDDEVFEPSVNIAHAWKVVEKLCSKGILVDITAAPDSEGRILTASCKAWDRPINEVVRELICVRTADTAPMAICRAALEAINARKMK